MHLWEISHPYDPIDVGREECMSLLSLSGFVCGAPRDRTVLYRWEWRAIDPQRRTAPGITRWPEDDDEARSQGPGWDAATEEFAIYGFYPLIPECWYLACPISRDQENDVRKLLESDYVVGRLTEMWSPLLDGKGARP